MGLWLKQSTAVTVKIGPFIDDTDGKTAETGLTEHPADIKLSKNGGAYAAKNEASNATHDTQGWYACALDATDTNTLGTLQLMCHEAGFLPVFHEYMVLPANVYNSLVLGSASDYLDVNVVSEDNIDFGATKKASLETAVDNGLDNAIPAVNTAGSVNDVLKDHLQSESDSILADTNELQTDWVNGGRLDVLVDAIKAVTDTLTLVAIADAVLDEVTEGATTLRQAMKLVCSALFAKTSGGGTNTLVARDIGDTKPRITLTVDADGNRTASVTDGS